MKDGCALSIIAAITDADAAEPSPTTSRSPWLDALLREARDVGAELILVSGGSAGVERIALDDVVDVAVRVIAAPARALTPELWGAGLMVASGRNVAFTIDQLTVERGWARAIEAGLSGSDVGVGGRILLGPAVSSTGRAVWYLRYSSFLLGDLQRRVVRDVAGDNAGYRREALLRGGQRYEHGFWEVEAHHRLRAGGATLAMVPGMAAAFSLAPRLRVMLRQRFAHGRHFGAWRAAVGGQHPARIALAAPLVPLVLLVRTARTVSRAGFPLGDLLRVTGPFLLLAVAWALGEGVGAWHPHRRDLALPRSVNA